MHGPLAEIGLVEVLQLLERGARSGVLRVVGPDPTAPRVLELRGGRIAALHPDADDAAVARALIARHLAAEDPGAPLDGPAAVAETERTALRERLAARALGEMMHWSRGRFDFEERPVPDGVLALSVDALILDVVDAETRRVELAVEFRDFHLVPAFVAPDRLRHGEPVTLEPIDWRILDAVDGVRDLAAVAAAIDEPPEDVAIRVRWLMGAAILELTEAPADVAVDARAAIEAGRYDDAVALLRTRVAAMPGDGTAWHTLGLAEVGAGRFDRAMEAWEAWRTAAPGHADEATSLIRAARTMLEALRDARE